MKSIIVNDRYVGDFYTVNVAESSTISLLMAEGRDVTSQFITDPTKPIPQGGFICNDIAGGNYFTEIVVTGTVVLGIKPA